MEKVLRRIQRQTLLHIQFEFAIRVDVRIGEGRQGTEVLGGHPLEPREVPPDLVVKCQALDIV
jgi:hypothetical protein